MEEKEEGESLPSPPTTTMQENRYAWQKWWRQASKPEITGNRPNQLPPTSTGEESIVDRERRSEYDGRREDEDGNTKKRRKRRSEGSTEKHKGGEKNLESRGLRRLMQKRKEGDFLGSETNVTETNRKRKVAVAFGSGSDGAVGNEPKRNENHNAKRGGHPPHAS